MGNRLIFLYHYGWFLQEGRRKIAQPHIGLSFGTGFKLVEGYPRTLRDKRGIITSRSDEEGTIVPTNWVILRFLEKLR